MRIVFMGTPDFAVPCLKRLIDDGHEIAGVFTQPDKPKGRGYALCPPPVKELALANGLAVYQPVKLRDGTSLALLQSLAPQLVVVVAYGRLLPKALLDCPPLGCVNIHGSLLPAYRGAAPIQWTVINGETVAGVTSIYMSEGMDEGDMIMTMETPVGENETGGELYERLAPLGAECLARTVELIAGGNPPRTAQNHALATTAPMLDKAMGRLDWGEGAQRLHNLVRGLNPWPGAQATAGGRLLKIHESRVADGTGAPGTVLDAKTATIACGEGALCLVTVQPEGKGRMGGADFLRGARLKDGDILI